MQSFLTTNNIYEKFDLLPAADVSNLVTLVLLDLTEDHRILLSWLEHYISGVALTAVSPTI